MEPFKIAAILDGISPLKGGGVSMRYHTQEISPAGMAQAMEYYQQFGWLLFAPEQRELEEVDIPKEKVQAEYAGRTPGQRLRAVLYVRWEQSKTTKDFETYYREQMEKIINQVKDRLQ
jgi:hypothetical protein